MYEHASVSHLRLTDVFSYITFVFVYLRISSKNKCEN